MSPAVIAVLVGLVLAAHYALSGVSEQRRQQVTRTAMLVGAGLALLLLVRLGLPWLAAVGAGILAAFRWIGPSIPRLLPWVISLLVRPPAPSRTSPSDVRARDSGAMTRVDALAVLGLQEDASDDEIRRAYSALIKKVHPDRGGSAYLASRVNLARDVLLPRDG